MTFSGVISRRDDRDVDLVVVLAVDQDRRARRRARGRGRSRRAGPRCSAGSRGAAAGRPSPGRSPSRRAAPSPPRSARSSTSCSPICSRSRFIIRSTIVMISSFVSLWKTITSSMRFSSSGRKTFLSSPMTRSFMSSYERPDSSPIEKPSDWFFEIVAGADVRGHDHDRVAEVDLAALGVGQLPVLEDLEQDVEDVRVGLLDLVEQDDRVRLAAHGLGELAALVVADVARRRADEPGHGVLLHVLRHVDLDHRVLVAEQELGERARQLGLADARGAEEDERAGRALRVLDARRARGGSTSRRRRSPPPGR